MLVQYLVQCFVQCEYRVLCNVKYQCGRLVLNLLHSIGILMHHHAPVSVSVMSSMVQWFSLYGASVVQCLYGVVTLDKGTRVA